jgi:hypothetical protein
VVSKKKRQEETAMGTKEKLVENLYKAIDIVILQEKTESIEEIKVRKNPKGWSLTITSVNRGSFEISPKLPRQLYKDVELKSIKKPQNYKAKSP